MMKAAANKDTCERPPTRMQLILGFTFVLHSLLFYLGEKCLFSFQMVSIMTQRVCVAKDYYATMVEF